MSDENKPDENSVPEPANEAEATPPPPAEPGPTDGAPREPLVFAQSATWGGILPITLLNAVLNIITVTLWRFWGRTRVRRYLWSTTTVNGTPLEYTGSGFELFIFVMLAIFLPIYAAMFAGQLLLPPDQFMIVFGLAYIPILLLFSWLLGVAVWVARRYRLSRTRWRGIRLGQTGSANGYAWASIGYSILTSLTLGWYAPAAEMRLTRRLWNETFFGDRRFAVDHPDEGLAGPLYPSFAIAWIAGVIGYFIFIGLYMALIIDDIEAGTTPVMDVMFLLKIYGAAAVYGIFVGIASLAYAAATFRRKAEVLTFEGVRFKLNVHMLSLAWIYIVNFLIVVFTLGFGLPIAQMRLWRYLLSRLKADGEIDIAAIRQNADKGPKSGEGLADAFDIGNVI